MYGFYTVPTPPNNEAAPMCPPIQVPQVQQAQMPQAVPQGMPQAMLHTGMSQTTMAVCEAPQMEGTWPPWQNWNTESPDGTSQYNAPGPQPAPQQLWPQDATWPQQGETQQWQEQQPTQTWQRELGHEILKQLGVGGPRPTGTHWNSRITVLPLGGFLELRYL